MKLLFDQNLSYKLCERLADLFPDSNQVRRAGLDTADDRAIWEYAKANGYVIASHDADFADMPYAPSALDSRRSTLDHALFVPKRLHKRLQFG